MNRRWCEGLDWVRVEELLEIAPDVYVKLLVARLQSIRDVNGAGAERLLQEEIKHRLAAELDAFGPTDYAACILEALRLVVEDNKLELAQIEKILRRSRLRVVQP